jgi:hypothetical protein
VNSAGLVELVPYNLLQYSEDISNSIWFKSEVSVTSSLAPDGSSTAYKLTPSTSNNFHYITQSTSRSVGNYYTLQIYAKADGYDTCRIATNSTDFGDVNLTSLSISLTNATGSITDIGNGWRRILITSSSDLSPEDVYIIVGTAPFAGNGTSGIFIWGAQLVEGTQAKDYFATETRLNIPRLDYSNGSCPSLLVEPQRTNLALYSNALSTGTNVVDYSTTTPNVYISPDGTQNAMQFTETTDNGRHGFYQYTTVTAQAYTASIFTKQTGRRYIACTSDMTGTAVTSYFDLQTKSVVSAGSGHNCSIQDFGNGWLRLILTFTASAGSRYVIWGGSPDGTNIAYLGSTSISQTFYGYQLEAGSYATSYIPTTSATVTRNADVISKTGISSLIGQTEGTIYWEGIANYGVSPKSNVIIDLRGTSTSSYLLIEVFNTGYIQFSSTSFGSNPLSSVPLPLNTNSRIALTYKAGNWKLYLNGVQVASSTAAIGFSDLNTLYIGYIDPSAGYLEKTQVKCVSLWQTALTNDQLEALTGTSFNTYAEMASYYNYTLQ